MNHNGNAYEIGVPAKVFWYVENGRSYGQTAEALNMPKSTVYKVYQKERERRETFIETGVNDVETIANEQTENVNVAPEKPFTPVSEPFTEPSFWREWWQFFHPADLLYYVRFIIAGAGVVGALQFVGYAVAGLLFCVALLSLHFVKVKTGWAKALHVLALAVVEACAFVADYSWVSGQLWSNIKSLPLTVWVEKYRNGADELVAFYAGPDVEKPYYIALSVAAVMLFAGAYAVGIGIQNSIKTKN